MCQASSVLSFNGIKKSSVLSFIGNYGFPKKFSKLLGVLIKNSPKAKPSVHRTGTAFVSLLFSSMSFLRFKSDSDDSTNPNPNEDGKRRTIDLGDGSEIIYIQRFLQFDESWKLFDYLNNEIPWTRPTIRVFGRSCLQPRDTCYVASAGLEDLSYSGYKPHAYFWDDYPPLKDILKAVQKAVPGSSFNSLLLNRYKGGNDYVSWHSDDEKLYGLTPEIASVSFGCEREFLLKKKKPSQSLQGKRSDDEPLRKRSKKNNDHANQHSFTLKHGSLLVMRGYTQRDWMHSVPKRANAEAIRINLTFRHVV